MHLIRGLTLLPVLESGCVLTIGNFDGLHLGHQSVIGRLVAHGRRLNLPVVAMVFEPQPLEFFLGDNAPARLTRLREKVLQFARLPVDYLVVLPFNQRLADYEAERFVRELLVGKLRVRHLVIGDDFHFGKARRGNFTLLKQFGVADGFTVESADSFLIDDLRVSSTLIRDALADGDLALAKRLLGRDYSMCGRVAHGRQLGRQIGFPTANLQLMRRSIPLRGVFAVRMAFDSHIRDGVANLGVRPTVDGKGRALLETHLFDFDGDLYGKQVEVFFHAKIRDEMRFDDLDQLRQQIALDSAQSRAVLGDLRGPG